MNPFIPSEEKNSQQKTECKGPRGALRGRRHSSSRHENHSYPCEQLLKSHTVTVPFKGRTGIDPGNAILVPDLFFWKH